MSTRTDSGVIAKAIRRSQRLKKAASEKRPITIEDSSDEISKRIRVEMPHGLVLIRFYETGEILVGHTDEAQVILKPQRGGVVIEWDKEREL